MNSFIRLLLTVLVALTLLVARSNAASLSIRLADKQVTVETHRLFRAPEDAARLDPAEYYVDTDLGFVLKKPVSGNWLAPELLEGAEECLGASSGLRSQESKERLRFVMQAHPLGRMLQGVEAIRYTAQDHLLVELTDESTNDIAEEVIRYTIESEEMLELDLSDQEVEKLKKNIRRSTVSLEEEVFANTLTVYAYDKRILFGLPVEHSLAGFSIFMLAQLAPKLDTLVADTNALLAGGSAAIKGVLVNGRMGGFRSDRVYLCTENEDKYYVVEIAFSPQADNPQRIWTDLEKMLTSFATLGER